MYCTTVTQLLKKNNSCSNTVKHTKFQSNVLETTAARNINAPFGCAAVTKSRSGEVDQESSDSDYSRSSIGRSVAFAMAADWGGGHTLLPSLPIFTNFRPTLKA